MYILIYPLSIANLSRGQRMDMQMQIRHGCLAHLLLVRNGRDRKLARLLLEKREWRRLDFLRVCPVVDAIPVEWVGQTHEDWPCLKKSN